MISLQDFKIEWQQYKEQRRTPAPPSHIIIIMRFIDAKDVNIHGGIHYVNGFWQTYYLSFFGVPESVIKVIDIALLRYNITEQQAKDIFDQHIDSYIKMSLFV